MTVLADPIAPGTRVRSNGGPYFGVVRRYFAKDPKSDELTYLIKWDLPDSSRPSEHYRSAFEPVEGSDMPEAKERYDWGEDPTAQDVIDALRMVVMAQKNPAEQAKILECLLEWAPDTDSSRGIDLLLRLISEATLKVSLVEH